MKHTSVYDGIINYIKANQDDIEVILECEMVDIEKCFPILESAPELLETCKGAIAALTQNKTYPIDIEVAKQFLSNAIAKAEGRE